VKTKAKTRQAGRRAIQKKPARKGWIDLLKVADQTALNLYAAEGLTNFQERADACIDRIRANDGDIRALPLEDQILIAQFIRDRGGMSADEIFAHIDTFVHDIALQDAKLKRLTEISEAKHKEAGYGEDESWPEDQRPADIQKLFDEYWERYDQLKVAILRHHGEDKMADLLVNDPDAYAARVEAGERICDERHPEKQ